LCINRYASLDIYSSKDFIHFKLKNKGEQIRMVRKSKYIREDFSLGSFRCFRGFTSL
jgi:hypothetical protein